MTLLRNTYTMLRDIYAAMWVAWHWQDLLQSTRDAIFDDMCRIRGVRKRSVPKKQTGRTQPPAAGQEQKEQCT